MVHQCGDRRILTFGNEVGQSSISLANPDHLEYGYTQAMFLATLLVSELRNALVLGMGGGSLVRALRSAYPGCSVTAVEGRAEVARVAHDWFFLPEERKTNIVIADAADYFAAEPKQCDLVFADLYQAESMDERQMQPEFLQGCRDALTPGGVFAANFWSGEFQAMQQTRLNLNRVFDERVLQLPVRGGNLVAFAFPDRQPALKRKAFYQDAENLGSKLDIPLHTLARNLWRQNAEALQVGRYRR